MNGIGDIFSSKARTEILRVLNELKEGAGLRQAARLANVHPHSAELVLAKLLHEGLVKSRHAGNRTVYALNRAHEDVPLLEAVFKAATNTSILAKSKSLQEKGKSILPFINSASRMLTRARRDIHVA